MITSIPTPPRAARPRHTFRCICKHNNHVFNMQTVLVLALALLACAHAFVTTGSKTAFGTHLFSECADKMRDAKGRCPGKLLLHIVTISRL